MSQFPTDDVGVDWARESVFWEKNVYFISIFGCFVYLPYTVHCLRCCAQENVSGSQFRIVPGGEVLASSQKGAVEGSEKDGSGSIITATEGQVAPTHSGEHFTGEIFDD